MQQRIEKSRFRFLHLKKGFRLQIDPVSPSLSNRPLITSQQLKRNCL